MKSNRQEERRAQIEDAAYRMLGEKGYAGTSVQAIARAAKASNETLYNWYGDKKGLMAALVARNTETVRATLAENVSVDPMDHLAHLGPALLDMVLGSRAVALNRAAAADPSGDLGRAISSGGRDVVAPLVTEIMVRAVANGSLKGQPEDLAQLYLTLLIGDQQIRRVIGAMEVPTPAQNAARAEDALATLQRPKHGESNNNENWYFYLYQ